MSNFEQLLDLEKFLELDDEVILDITIIIQTIKSW